MRPNETTELTVTVGRDATETLLQLCAHQLSSLLPGADLTAADLWLNPKSAGRSVVGLQQVATDTKDLGGDATAIAAGYKVAAPTVQIR